MSNNKCKTCRGLISKKSLVKSFGESFCSIKCVEEYFDHIHQEDEYHITSNKYFEVSGKSRYIISRI